MGFASLEIGKSALLAANYGLQVTGQNISNSNTTGYSRQVTTQSGAVTTRTGAYIFGNGVNVTSVGQITNVFAERQLRQATSNNSYATTINSCYSSLETNFLAVTSSATESSTGNALSDDMSSFWDSLSNLSSHVETLSSRTAVLSDATALADHFKSLYTQMSQARSDANTAVENSITRINELASTIANLNKAIVTSESGGLAASTANDLRDQRSNALRELSELVNIEVSDETNGSCIVSVNGRSLVYFDQTYEVTAKYEKSGDLVVAVPCFARDSYPLNPSSGSLAANIEARDVIIKSYMDDLDSLAASFTWEFNRLYSQTRGTEAFDSITSLYSPIDPSVALSDLEFKSSTVDGTFQIVNGNLELIVYNENTGQETSVSVEIDLDGRLSPDGEPDMILWDPTNPDASNSLINRMQTALDSAVPGAFKVSIDNDYKVTVESLSDDYGFCFGSDTSGVLAALGMNVLFTGHTAADIGVNQTLASNPQYVGVANSFAASDNSGVLSLIEFSETGIDRLSGQSPDEYYLSMMGRLGSEASTAISQKELREDVYNQIFTLRESTSGVNDDEEAVNLLAYQRAYQSAARFISIVDEIYETLINM